MNSRLGELRLGSDAKPLKWATLYCLKHHPKELLFFRSRLGLFEVANTLFKTDARLSFYNPLLCTEVQPVGFSEAEYESADWESFSRRVLRSPRTANVLSVNQCVFGTVTALVDVTPQLLGAPTSSLVC